MAPVQLGPTDQIRNLLAVYCQFVDHGRFSELGELFSRGKLCDQDGRLMAEGTEAAAQHFTSIVRLYEDGTPRTHHLILNTVFATPTEDGFIKADSSYVVLQQFPDGQLQPIITGDYHDTFAHDGEQWYFAERRYHGRLTGNLSHHLLISIPGVSE